MIALGFFNPAFLWALPLAAVPIIIHLLNRRRFKTVPWAAMEYLLRALKQNRRRLQMEHWILLVLRTLAVVALVFLVSRPQMSGGLLRATTHHVVCLDNSASMAHRRGSGSAYTAGIDKVDQLVQKLVNANNGDLFTLLRSSDPGKPDILTARVGEKLPALVREVLGHNQPGDGAVNADVLLQKAQEFAGQAEGAGATSYYLITDSRLHDWLTRDGKGRPAVLRHLQTMDPDKQSLVVEIVGARDTSNLAITSVSRKDRLARLGIPVTIQVEVTNRSQETSAAAEVAVAIEGASLITLNLEPLAAGESRVLDVEHTFYEPGFKGVTATLPPDRFAGDDQRSLALEVLASSNVLLVDGDPQEDAETSETHYLSSALDVGGDVISGIGVTVIPDHDLAAYELTDTTMIWLCNVAAPVPEVVSKLEEYVAKGGGLVIYLGNQVEATRYNDAFYKSGAGLLPLPLTELQGDMDRPQHLFLADQSHPVMAGQTDVLTFFFAKYVLVGRYFGLAEDATASVSTALRVGGASGGPVMVSKDYGQGGPVTLITTTADAHWTNWPLTEAFLVFCQELHNQSVRLHSLAAHNPASSGTLRMSLDPGIYRRDVLVQGLGEDGEESTYSAQDKAETEEGKVDSELLIPLHDLRGRGLFRLTLSPHSGNPEERLFSRNIPVAEGILQRLSQAGWLQAYPDFADRMQVRSGTDGSAGQEGDGQGEMWWFICLLLLGFLLVESVLAWRYGRR